MRALSFCAALIFMTVTTVAAQATTIIVTDRFTFGGGRFAGETATIVYSYEAPDPGQSILTFSPDFSASLTFLNIVDAAPDTKDIVFSGGGGLLAPEIFGFWSFDPAGNSDEMELISVDPAGIVIEAGGVILQFTVEDSRDSPGSTFRRTVNAVPAPAPLLLMATGIAVFAGARRLRRKA